MLSVIGRNGSPGKLIDADSRLLDVLEMFDSPKSIRSALGTASKKVHELVQPMIDLKLLASPDCLPEACDLWWGLLRRTKLDNFRFAQPASRVEKVDDLPIFVIDDSIHPNALPALTLWFSLLSFMRNDVDSDLAAKSPHWMSPICRSDARRAVAQSSLLAHLDATARDAFSYAQLELLELRAYSTAYGDHPTVHRDSETFPSVSAVLYCNSEWRRDWMGELLICDSSEEPRVAVAPRPGRIVVFRGDLPHRAGAPSRATFDNRLALVMRYALTSDLS
jgi:hypothetical protein